MNDLCLWMHSRVLKKWFQDCLHVLNLTHARAKRSSLIYVPQVFHALIGANVRAYYVGASLYATLVLQAKAWARGYPPLNYQYLFCDDWASFIIKVAVALWWPLQFEINK